MVYKLYYFDIKGKGEPIRLLFHAVNQDFEDVRVPFDKWDEVKKTMPTGLMPVLEVDGKKLPESLAILRFLARKFNMEGKGEFEIAMADAISEVINDFSVNYKPFIREKDEKRRNQHTEMFKNEATPALLKSLVNLKKVCGTDNHLVGDSLTYVDILFSVTLQLVEHFGKYNVELPVELRGICESVKSNPGIARYLSKGLSQTISLPTIGN